MTHLFEFTILKRLLSSKWFSSRPPVAFQSKPPSLLFCINLFGKKRNLIKGTLTQINPHCTGPIKSWMCHTGLWNKYLIKAPEVRAMRQAYQVERPNTWPFKWTLSCYSIMPTCPIFFSKKGNWKRHSSGLIKHIKCSLCHIWSWLCWPMNTQSYFQSSNKWAVSHSHPPSSAPGDAVFQPAPGPRGVFSL